MRLRRVLPVFLFLAAAFPAVVDGHVNRQVGPYAFLVVLVEEPTFEDNHAGFKFWVRRDEVPVVGLESTVQAVATGHGQRVELIVPPVDGVGFYVLDQSLDNVAFDPLGGGSWTLELTGSVEGTPIDVTFPVTFPSYPRVAAGQPAPATSPVGDTSATPPIALLVAALVPLAAVLAAWATRARRGLHTS
jgi:hypothetical protein